MHIKRVIIQGFKTYKDRTVIEDFSPKQNVILGKNGSGKSNVYNAIQFVLSDKYSSLRQDERQALLHEGSGREVMSASVEVIFDNKDMRFPIDSAEISIKRTIGLKKDEFFLNNKHIGKTEVVNLLESAGLSRSNPYYIVEQGKVRHLIKMSDSERLELLKEIAGTRTYDDRRKESLKIMTDTDSRREQIEEVVEYIETRLAELEDEKKELKLFQRLDTQRRSIEYTIYEQELAETQEKLKDIAAMRQTWSEKTQKAHMNQQTAEKNRQDAEEEITLAQSQLAKSSSLKKKSANEKRKMTERKTKLDLSIKQQQENQATQAQQLQQAQQDKEAVDSDIARSEKELARSKREYEEALGEEEKVVARLSYCEQRVNELYDKQDRSTQFSTKKERDVFLKKQIKETEASLKKERKQMANTQAGKAEDEEKQKEARAYLSSLQEKMDSIRQEIAAADGEYTNLKQKRDEASNQRKELWRKQTMIGSGAGSSGVRAANRSRGRQGKGKGRQADTQVTSTDSLQNALNKCKRAVQFTMDKELYRGLQSVKRIAAEEKIGGVHGPLLELFTTDSKFEKCVETTAGNSLFHVVVDTDETASRIIKLLNRQKAGRVTFMPLNQLSKSARPRNFPDSSDVIPMIQKLRYDAKFEPAVQQVFGKTLIARNLEVASQMSRAYNLDSITLGGDQINKRGALSGGFIDHKRSRMACQRQLKEAEKAFNQAKEESDKITREIEVCDQRVSKFMGEILKSREAKSHLRGQYQSSEQEMRNKKKEMKVTELSLQRHDKQAKKVNSTVLQLEQRKEALQEEAASPFMEDLDSQDSEDVRELNQEITDLKQKQIETAAIRGKKEGEMNTLEHSLQGNLLKRREELAAVISNRSTSKNDDGDELERALHELSVVIEGIEELNARQQQYESEIERFEQQVTEVGARLEGLKKDEQSNLKDLNKESNSMERLLNTRNVLLQKKSDCVIKIQELGSIPRNLSEYSSIKVPKLMKKLQSVNNQLKKYSHVNKKAIDQYMSFSEQKVELLARKEELDRGRSSILDLIDHLDQKKDQAIERTFKGIAKHFSTVFRELVPQGKGTLVIQTKSLEDNDSDSEEEDEEGSEGELGEEKYEEKENRSSNRGKKRRKSGVSKKKGNKNKKRKKSSSSSSSASRQSSVSHYSGVSIRVSFTGSDQPQTMVALSGGQQSVVALALIFAIQRCDPSPFYLFDEIDSNLDAVHRTSVANIVNKQATNTQFIITTFRSEFLAASDKCFGVAYRNKVSRISEISRSEARELILVNEQQSRSK